MIETRIKRFGLSLKQGVDFDLIDPEDDPRYRDYVATYLEAAGRRGITPDAARTLVRTNNTVIGAIAVRRGEADALICGLEGRFETRLRVIRDMIGLAPGVLDFAAMSLIVTKKGAYFLADTHVRPDPSAEEIADVAVACAEHVRRFGLTPKIALLSHSDFGAVGFALGGEDAHRPRPDPRAPARPRGRRRDAGRFRPVGADPRPGDAGLAPEGRGQRADPAEPRRGQHRLPVRQGAGRRPARRARCSSARPSPPTSCRPR